MRFGAIAIGLFSIVATSACSYGPQVGSPFDGPARQSTSLRVDNDHPLDVRISVLRGPVALPVGRVGGMSTVTLELTSSQLSEVGPIRFEIRESTGRERVLTLPVLAGPGHPIHLQVNHGLTRSTATVS